MTTATARPPTHFAQKVVLPFDFPRTGIAASGSILVDTNANMADGNTVTLDDGFRKVVYEYDKSANGVVAGNVSWAAGAGTAAQSAATLKTAINGAQTAFVVTDNLDGTLTVTQRWPGSGGNVTWTKSSASALAVTSPTGGTDPAGNILADTTIKLHKVKTRGLKVTRVHLNLPAGLAGHASNYANFKLIKGASTVIANWSTLSSADSTITADTPVELNLSATIANLYLADGDQLSLFIDVTGTPTVPPGRIVVEGFEQ